MASTLGALRKLVAQHPDLPDETPLVVESSDHNFRQVYAVVGDILVNRYGQLEMWTGDPQDYGAEDDNGLKNAGYRVKQALILE